MCRETVCAVWCEDERRCMAEEWYDRLSSFLQRSVRVFCGERVSKSNSCAMMRWFLAE